MKILEQGREQIGWASERRCTGDGNQGGGCGALLLVEQADIYATYASYMGRDEEWFATFRCPCGVETDMPIDALPGHVWSAAMEKWRERRKDPR